MIIFKAFQGLENFYIKFQDFPYFSRICMNPEGTEKHMQQKVEKQTKLQNPDIRSENKAGLLL